MPSLFFYKPFHTRVRGRLKCSGLDDMCPVGSISAALLSSAFGVQAHFLEQRLVIDATCSSTGDSDWTVLKQREANWIIDCISITNVQYEELRIAEMYDYSAQEIINVDQPSVDELKWCAHQDRNALFFSQHVPIRWRVQAARAICSEYVCSIFSP